MNIVKAVKENNLEKVKKYWYEDITFNKCEALKIASRKGYNDIFNLFVYDERIRIYVYQNCKLTNEDKYYLLRYPTDIRKTVSVGRIRIGQKRKLRTAEKDAVMEEFKNIDVTSGSGNKIDGIPAKSLSPMILGPVDDC